MADTVTLEAVIRRNSDGETRIHRYDINPEHVSSQAFWWGDGNASCDCNRHLFFEAEGGNDCEDGYYDCGDTAYSVPSVKRCDTGEAIYKDGERTRPA